jgi:hypothetical protein
VDSLLLFSFDLTSIVVSAYLRTTNEVLYKLDDWLEMRRNYAAYFVFYTQFMRATVGKRPFRQRLRSMAVGDEIATVSDEALTLLGIENSYEMWNDVYKISDGEIRSVRNDEKVPEHWKSEILPKYTRTSNSDPANQRNTEDKRWSSEGILRFNVLCQLVIKDRVDHPDFKITWLNQVREQIKQGNLDTDVDDVEDPTQVNADDDLFPETVAAHPVLNPAKQKLGVSTGAHSDNEDSSQGNRVGRDCIALIVYVFH